MDRLIFAKFAKRHSLFNSGLIDTLAELEGKGNYKDILQKIFGIGPSGAASFLSSWKSFNHYPLDDSDLAKKGLHVARHIFANYEHLDRSTWGAFNKSGLLKFEDFLSKGDASELAHYAKSVPPSVNKQANNMCGDILIKNPEFKDITDQCIGVDTEAELYRNTFAQTVHNKMDDNDEQKDYHLDTFFPALKFWWFPEDVEVDQGPFVYIENSPQMTDEKLDWYYQQTCLVTEGSWDKSRRRGHPEGSLRVNETELFLMNLHACPVPVKANTLVVANVGGFHGRGDVASEHIRRAIHGSVRISEPFTG